MSSGLKGLEKIVILGESGVGKTSLMFRYVQNQFSNMYKATIGADFCTKDVTVGDELITLQIWDTAGQERFQSLGQAFYRGADACVLVYDVQSVATFDKLEALREQFIRGADVADPADFPFIVLGNKVDVDAKRHAVDQNKVKAWCESKGNIPHFLVSAKDGTNVEQGFLTVVTAAAKRIKHEEPILPETVRLDMTRKEKEGCAC